jgi:hypothetical protein
MLVSWAMSGDGWTSEAEERPMVHRLISRSLPALRIVAVSLPGS